MALLIVFGIIIIYITICNTLSDMDRKKYKWLRECWDNGKVIWYYDDANWWKFISKKDFDEKYEAEERRQERLKKRNKEKEKMWYKIKQD